MVGSWLVWCYIYRNLEIGYNLLFWQRIHSLWEVLGFQVLGSVASAIKGALAQLV